MGTSTLSRFQRGALAQLVSEGHHTYQDMADALGVAKSTVYYELKRVVPYDPQVAQFDADQKRRQCGRPLGLTAALKCLIENHLRLTWSPEMIANAYGLNTASIYNWLSRGDLDFPLCELPNRNVRLRRAGETRGTFKVSQSIEDRPQAVNDRRSFGHWEVDTVLSSRGQAKDCLVTFVERKTRLVWAIKAPNRTSVALNEAFNQFMVRFRTTVKSITVDHGKEFSGYQELEDIHHIKVYFCHPYSPWERASNEYFNRRLRWFFPKKTNFSEITKDQLVESLDLINHRPLKTLDHHTAIEFFNRCSN